MVIEYSQEVKGLAFAYRFTEEEKQEIAMGLKMRIREIKKKKERIINHKNNEGQAKYSLKVQTLNFFIEDIEDIIKEFSD